MQIKKFDIKLENFLPRKNLLVWDPNLPTKNCRSPYLSPRKDHMNDWKLPSTIVPPNHPKSYWLVESLYEIISLVQGHPFSPMIMSKFCSHFYCFIWTADCKWTNHLPAKCHFLHVKKGLLNAYVSFWLSINLIKIHGISGQFLDKVWWRQSQIWRVPLRLPYVYSKSIFLRNYCRYLLYICTDERMKAPLSENELLVGCVEA